MPHFVVAGPGKGKAGIVASTFKEFVSKCRRKFGYKKDQEQDIVVYLDDDTEVDEEYFEVLSAGTHLRISCAGEAKTPDYIHQLAIFLHACLEREPDLHKRVLGCLQEPLTSDRAASLLELLAKTANNTTSLTSRDTDVEWFRGLDTKYKTKEGVLKNSAESRMRGYFHYTRQELQSGTPPGHTHISQAITFFQHKLRNSKYNSSYFDRSASPGERLCDSCGLFPCEGPFDQTTCPALHFINPYASREARIIFSTWNLDHVIEKSRTILPTLKTSLSGQKASRVNLQYFHDLLFHHMNSTDTRTPSGNLKLVHVACHVKKPHHLKLQPKNIYLSQDGVDGPQAHSQPIHIHHRRKRLHWESSYYTRSKKIHLGSTTGGCEWSQV